MSLPIKDLKDLKAKCYTVLIPGGWYTAEYTCLEALEARGPNKDRFNILDVVTALKRLVDDGDVVVCWGITTGYGCRGAIFEDIEEAASNLDYWGLAPTALTPLYRWRQRSSR